MKRLTLMAAIAVCAASLSTAALAAEGGVAKGTVRECGLSREGGVAYITVILRGEGAWSARLVASSRNPELFARTAELGEGDQVTISYTEEDGRQWVREVNLIKRAEVNEAERREREERERREGERKEGDRDEGAVKRESRQGDREGDREGDVKRERREGDREGLERAKRLFRRDGEGEKSGPRDGEGVKTGPRDGEGEQAKGVIKDLITDGELIAMVGPDARRQVTYRYVICVKMKSGNVELFEAFLDPEKKNMMPKVAERVREIIGSEEFRKLQTERLEGVRQRIKDAVNELMGQDVIEEVIFKTWSVLM
jgi:hypothetical protein